MKKRILFLIIGVLLLTGCRLNVKINATNNNTNTQKNNVEVNASVGYLYFYAPKDYTYRSDLRGLAYREDEKKVYIKGDYENDPDNVIVIVIHVENMNKGAKQYADEINNKLSESDVKYVMKSNGQITEIYARENYVIGNNVNYAYITDQAGYIHIVNIKGPKDKSDEIANVVNEIYSSLKY